MTSAHFSRRVLVRGLAFSSFSLALALAGCKPADAPNSATSGTTTGNAAPSTSSTNDATGNSGTTTTTVNTGDSVKIGHFASMTGANATFGQSMDKGIRMAFDEINANKPPLGKKVEVITGDDGSQSGQVPSVVQKMIGQDNVDVLMGEVASTLSLTAAPIAQKAGVPMVSPASTNVDVTKGGNYIFRTCFIDPFQGSVMAKFASANLKAKKAALLTDAASDYSKGLTKAFEEAWTKDGGQIVDRESYVAGDMDFGAQLTKIKAASPDVIYIPGYYNEVGNIAKQARRAGITQPMMGGDGWDSAQLYKIGGSAVNGCYFSNHYSPQSKDPNIVKFVTDFKAKYGGEVPDAMAALGYDAAYIVSDAITRAGSLDKAKVRDAIAATKDYPGVTGVTSIGPDRNAVKSAVVLKIENNQGNYVTTIKP